MTEKDCVHAFKSARREQARGGVAAATITTKFKFNGWSYAFGLVSLLHLAAYWGWRNVVTLLVSVYKCAANCMQHVTTFPSTAPATNHLFFLA